MDTDELRELHKAIEKGDLELVRHLLVSQPEGQHFSYDDTSALYWAFYCEKYEIASYLIFKGARIYESEIDNLYDLDIDLTRINDLLLRYNKKSEKSCIFQLMSRSQSPQDLEGKHHHSLMSMYEELFKSKIIRLLMRVLEREVFDIVYDFQSDDVNKIYCLSEEKCEVYGLTLSNSNEIFIGAKNLLSDNPQKRAKVFGVVAEELCHLALTILFENDAKPYREEDSGLKNTFKDIVLAVQSLLCETCNLESVIKDVFNLYIPLKWDSELIARVPHVLAIYGEEDGRMIFLESSALSKLFSYYENNVLPACENYTDPLLNTKSHREMERLIKESEFISFKEKQIKPLKDGDKGSIRDYLFEKKEIAHIITNCTKLCTLHIYHEMKEKFPMLIKKKCLFFTSKCFEIKSKEILNSFKGNVWDYMTIVFDGKEFDFKSFIKIYYLDHFDVYDDKLKIIIISNSPSLSQGLQPLVINYNWNDLSEEYKKFRTDPITYSFKGEREGIFVDMNEVPMNFGEKDLLSIISGEIIEVDDGTELYSEGYVPATYIERMLKVEIVKKEIFHNLPLNSNIFISGLDSLHFKSLLIEERLVQWLHGSEDEILSDKSIIINNEQDPMTFEQFVRKHPGRANIWLHFDKDEFILRNSYECGDVIKQYARQKLLSEKDMVEFLRWKRIAIISDNAGNGKSTVISSMIDHVKKNIYQSWIWRIDFKKFSIKEEDPLSLANIKSSSTDEDIFEYLFCMLGIFNGLEKLFFWKFSKHGLCFIFFDGFDEVPSKYRENALKLLTTVSEKTEANVLVATRKHHQEKLEKLLKVFSHEMVPLSEEAQVLYLEKLWKNKLKNHIGGGIKTYERVKKSLSQTIEKISQQLEKEESELENWELRIALEKIVHVLEKIDSGDSLEQVSLEIDHLDFTKLAELILEKIFHNEDTLDFTGTPLHLYMIGIIHYNGKFNVEIKYDIYSLYSHFIEHKILIYLEEKERLCHEGSLKDKIVAGVRKDTYRIHAELAAQLIDGEIVCSVSDMDDDDLELCSALGMVFIYGGSVYFLHQTFAEFFMAESLKRKMPKEMFSNMLLNDKYSLVRRFLSSNLEKKTFVKLTKDVNYLVEIMKNIIAKHPISRLYKSDSNMTCVFKMMKMLLETFQEKEKQELVDEFLEEVESGLPLKEFSYVGGFLPVSMIKKLIAKNFKDYSVIILNFLSYSQNSEEVVDLLRESISIRSECGLYKGEAEVACILDLFSLKDSEEDGFILYSLCNDKAEIFPCILKFFKDVLGNDQFMNLIIQNEEFVSQLQGFFNKIELSKVCHSLREVSKIFGNEIDILLNKDSKFLILENAIYRNNFFNISNSFKLVTSLFCDIFGSNQVKDLVKSSNSHGEYLTQKLAFWYSAENFMKTFSVIKDILNNPNEVKQLLKRKDDGLRNMLHLASFRDKDLHDLFQLYFDILEKNEIKEELLNKEIFGHNVVHIIVLKNSSEIIIRNLHHIQKLIKDDEWFKQFLKSLSEAKQNIFHFAASRDFYIDDLLRFCDPLIGKYEMKKMLLSTDSLDFNVLHLLALNNSSVTLNKNFISIKEIIGDNEWLKQLLKSKGQNCLNVLQLVSLRDKSLGDLLEICDHLIEKDEIKEMLNSTDVDGDNVIHISVLKNSSGTLCKNLHSIHKILGDCEWFRQYLQSKGQQLRNIIHLASTEDKNLHDLLQFCCAHLGKDEIETLFLSADIYGNNAVHLLLLNNSRGNLMLNLKLTRDIASDQCFKNLLTHVDINFSNIFHLASLNNLCFDCLLQFHNSSLNAEEIKEMLMATMEDGLNAVHLMVLKNSAATLRNNLELVKEVLNDIDFFKQLLMSKDESLKNVFQLACVDNLQLNDVLQIFHNYLEEDEFKEMLFNCDTEGNNLIHLSILNNSFKIIQSNVKEIKEYLDVQSMNTLLMSKGQMFRNIIHLAAMQEDICLDDFLKFCELYLKKDIILGMLCDTDEEDYNVIHISILYNSSKRLMGILNALSEILEKNDFLKVLLKGRTQNLSNIIHLVSLKDIPAREFGDLFNFFLLHLEKEEIKELLLGTDMDGFNVLHNLVVSNSSKNQIENLRLVQDILKDHECFKQLLQSQGKLMSNIFHLSSMKNMNLEDLFHFCATFLDKFEIRDMFLSPNEYGDNALHLMVSNYSCQTLISSLEALKEILGNEEWFKQVLMTKSGRLVNTFHLASLKGENFCNLLKFYASQLETDEIKEMIFSTDEEGDNILHYLVMNNTSDILKENMETIREMLLHEGSFKKLLKSTNKYSRNAFHLASMKDILIGDQLKYWDMYLAKDEMKELLLHVDAESHSILHHLLSSNSADIFLGNFKLIGDFFGEYEWFVHLLKCEGQSLPNIFRLACTEGMYVYNILQFCEAHLGRNKMKEMLLSAIDTGCNVVHLTISKNFCETLVNSLMLIKDILDDDHLLKNLVKSKNQHSQNLFHISSSNDMCLDSLLQFCISLLGKDDVVEMLLSTDSRSNNTLHALVLNNSLEMLNKNLCLLENLLGKDEWFQQLLFSKGQNSSNAILLASLKDVDIQELICIYRRILVKEDFEEILLSTNEVGNNVLHLLVLNNSSETLMKNIKLLKECLDDKFLRQLLKSRGNSFYNALNIASFKDMNLYDLLHLYDSHVDRKDIKEIIMGPDLHLNTLMHHLILSNSSIILRDNFQSIKDILGVECFKELLRMKGQSSRNIFHLAACKDVWLDHILQVCIEDLGNEGVKQMFLEVDEQDCNVMHLLVLANSTETLRHNFCIIKTFLMENEWFRQILLSIGRSASNIFHFAANNKKKPLNELLLMCNDNLTKKEIIELLLSKDGDGDNLIHILVKNNSSDTLISNLNVLKDVIDDKECFQELLKIKDNSLRNILQIASADKHIDELLLFLDANLEKDEVNDLLISADSNGDNIIHISLLNASSEVMRGNFLSIRDVLGGNEHFRVILQSKGQLSSNIFHLASINMSGIEFICFLQFCEDFFKKDEIEEMLFSVIDKGNNVLHLLVQNNSPEELVDCLLAMKKIFEDDSCFKIFLKSKGIYSYNIFHFAAELNMNLNELLRFFDAHFEKIEIKEMLFSTHLEGQNVMHILALRNSTETLEENLNLIKEILDDDDCYKKFLKSKDLSMKNIFHFVSMNTILKNGNELNPNVFNRHLSQHEITHLMVERDENGETFLHIAALYFDELLLLLDYAHNVIDENHFIELILSEDNDKCTFLHHLGSRFDVDTGVKVLNTLKEKLPDEIFMCLLKVKNKKGQIFLQGDSKIRDKLIKCCRIVLDDDWLEELL